MCAAIYFGRLLLGKTSIIKYEATLDQQILLQFSRKLYVLFKQESYSHCGDVFLQCYNVVILPCLIIPVLHHSMYDNG